VGQAVEFKYVPIWHVKQVVELQVEQLVRVQAEHWLLASVEL